MLEQKEASDKAKGLRIALNLSSETIVTCENCRSNDDCPFAWHFYNTDGDCLMEK